VIWALVIVGVVALLFCVAGLYLINRRLQALSEPGPSLVIVHQHAGPTLEGVLTRRTTDAYCLENPKMLEAENMTVPLDGTVEIPRERVLFVQLVARGA
jgi:hypothetical protein